MVEDGYGATSVRGIADRSGLTSGAIYGHFPSKTSFLGEDVRERLTEDLEHRGTLEERVSRADSPTTSAHAGSAVNCAS